MQPVSPSLGRDGHPAPVSRGRTVGLLSSYRTEVAIAIAIVLLEVAVGLLVPSALSWGNVANIAQARMLHEEVNTCTMTHALYPLSLCELHQIYFDGSTHSASQCLDTI